MNFGEAIKCMKKGKKVTRNVWKENFFNGRKQFIFIGKNKGLTTKTFLAILPEEECFSDCIMGYTRKGIFQPNWTPTQPLYHTARLAELTGSAGSVLL